MAEDARDYLRELNLEGVMRQLVAVVQPDQVTYYLDDGAHHVEQLASLVNRDFDVSRVIELGANIADAMGVNGTTVPAPRARPTTTPAPPSKAPAKGRKGPSIRQRPPFALTNDMVLRDIRANPGTIARETAMRLLRENSDASKAAVDRRAKELEVAGIIMFGERVMDNFRGRNPRSYIPLDVPLQSGPVDELSSGASGPASDDESGEQPPLL